MRIFTLSTLRVRMGQVTEMISVSLAAFVACSACIFALLVLFGSLFDFGIYT